MAAPAPVADPIEDAVRAKVKVALAKSLSEELSTLLEAKLAQSFATGTSYKSAFRTLTALLKPRSAADTIAAPAGKHAAPASDFENVVADLTSKKLSAGKLINRVGDIEKTKRNLITEAASTAAASSAGSELSSEFGAAQRKRQVGVITARIKASKDAVASSGASDAAAWASIADSSLELFNLYSPNTAWLTQALKAMRQCQAVSSEFVAKNPSFWLKRANVHVVREEFAEAIEDLKAFAASKEVASDAAAAAAASSTPTPSHAALAAPRIKAVVAYVSTVSKLVSSVCKLRESEVRTLIQAMPNPSRASLQRDFVTLALLKPGLNEGKGMVLHVLAKIDQTSVYALQKNANPDGAVLPLPTVHDSLECAFRAPLSYVVIDSDGKCCVLSLFNVMGDAKKQRPIRQGDALLTADPFIKEVAINEGEKQGAYRSIQILNPNFLLILDQKAHRMEPYNDLDHAEMFE